MKVQYTMAHVFGAHLHQEEYDKAATVFEFNSVATHAGRKYDAPIADMRLFVFFADGTFFAADPAVMRKVYRHVGEIADDGAFDLPEVTV